MRKNLIKKISLAAAISIAVSALTVGAAAAEAVKTNHHHIGGTSVNTTCTADGYCN